MFTSFFLKKKKKIKMVPFWNAELNKGLKKAIETSKGQKFKNEDQQIFQPFLSLLEASVFRIFFLKNEILKPTKII